MPARRRARPDSADGTGHTPQRGRNSDPRTSSLRAHCSSHFGVGVAIDASTPFGFKQGDRAFSTTYVFRSPLALVAPLSLAAETCTRQRTALERLACVRRSSERNSE